jgi:hypothetical protein
LDPAGLERGEFRFELTQEVHSLTQLVLGDDYVSFDELSERSPEAAEHGDAEFLRLRTVLGVRYGLGDGPEMRLDVPIELVRSKTSEQDNHHRNETLDGLGDLRLAYRWPLQRSESWRVWGTVGTSLPTGRSSRVQASSFLDHDEAADLGVTVPEHTHLRLGTGTFDPFLSLAVDHTFSERLTGLAFLQVSLPFEADSNGYRTGRSATLLAGPDWTWPKGGLSSALLCEVAWADRDRFSGPDVVGPGGTFSGRFGVPNTGRTEVALRAVLGGVTSRGAWNLQLRVPVYTSIREDAQNGDVQLTEPVGLILGWRFGA